MNPFLSWSAWMTGVYTFGGVFNIRACPARPLDPEPVPGFPSLCYAESRHVRCIPKQFRVLALEWP